jgi:peptidoglycan/xylan/chitin deacetylase (PgdA/CDA1 family)
MLVGSLWSAVLPETAAAGRTGIVAPGTNAAAPPARGSSSVRLKRKAGSAFPRFDGGVPVLLYHRLGPGNRGYSIAPALFEAQLRRLHDLGFEAVTLDQFVRFVRGEPVELPERPVLITFDDGYVSAWENADPILARYGWSAVMYVPTGVVGRPGRLTWEELRQMQSSGRWQIDEHAGDGHVQITADAAGRQLPFYASERWTDGEQESFARYRGRVSGDIERGSALLAQNLPGWIPQRSFAVPYNNYGQNGSNDPRIEPWLSGYLTSRFAVVFVQRGDDSFATPDPGFANRLGLTSQWDADRLETRLLHGLEQLEPRHAQRVRASSRTS